MGSSTISFNKAEFEANDTYIALWLLEVIRQIDQENENENWLSKLRDEWFIQATEGFGFGVCPNLTDWLTTDVRRAQMVELCQRTLRSLETRRTAFSVEELEESGVGGNDVSYSKEIPTEPVAEVGRRFLALLDFDRRGPTFHRKNG